MQIVMIGTGYVGLVSGACFADFGHHVTCVDKDESKIDALLNGRIPIFEPGLDALVESNVAAGRLNFTLDLASVLPEADAVFIAVGTPSRRGDGHADLSYVYAAAEEMAPLLREGAVVVDKSTVPVGTGDEVETIIRKVCPELKFSVASNPEFLREGAAIDDFKRPDRVVIGVNDAHAEEVLQEIYRPLTRNDSPILTMSRRAAELTKYAANAFLATKISFINEIADLCEEVGADVRDVARGIGTDSRIGSRFLQPGPGYGGSCFPKDTLALLKTGQNYGSPLKIVEAVVAVNDQRKSAMGAKVIEALGGDVAGKTVALLGLTFKANTDDMRDSPAIEIAQALQDAGITVRAYDPEGMETSKAVISNLVYCDDSYDAMTGADAAVIVTEWDAFRALDLGKAKELLNRPLLVDLRNLYSRTDVEKQGFEYVAVGR
ncbi:UDP-glucose dehydrogenase family protein [Alteraurantiacibacter aquimixticola]|uniref:UDP-glucose 6-dehydrogenase n=1 Tax=Alteraurantiacibacter aquimixticola TaxID=2489173 RepID=A0A4T3F4L5_9SPHN|nr:UDP-glucose/GDP-mannose dehydrogenase family protein [Alteraurantiacibacter aquimixticola]TIX51399.1 UDP-glucose/GDP-mannose dehydrogenase family protein [Alteraurantiacibacter aquimixticola]